MILGEYAQCSFLWGMFTKNRKLVYWTPGNRGAKKNTDIELKNSSFQTILNYRRADAFIYGKLYYSFATTKEREESERYF